jgi:hypothetical protein
MPLSTMDNINLPRTWHSSCHSFSHLSPTFDQYQQNAVLFRYSPRSPCHRCPRCSSPDLHASVRYRECVFKFYHPSMGLLIDIICVPQSRLCHRPGRHRRRMRRSCCPGRTRCFPLSLLSQSFLLNHPLQRSLSRLEMHYSHLQNIRRGPFFSVLQNFAWNTH